MIGDIFRQEREKRNLTLKDIENETNIRAGYIEAIEKGEYSTIRGEVYLKGFIKTYANFLNLNVTEIFEQYNAEKGIAALSNDSAAEAPESKPLEAKTITKPAAPPARKYKKRQTSNKGVGNIVFGGIITLIIIACLAYFIIPLFSSTNKIDPAPQETAQTSVPATTQTAPPAPAPVSGVHIKAVFNNKCWVQVKSDGKVILEKTVDKGSDFTWDGQKDVEIILGNAGAAKIVFNGKDVGELGQNGSVIKKRFADNKIEDISK